MTRIIAGRAKGRRLTTPRGDATRPTSDRVREALFSAVESWCGTWQGMRVLDLYAGSGAVGLEAWSRGAEAVTLVEHDRTTARLVRANARDLGATGVEVLAATVATVLRGAPAAPFDLVFSDPPYPLTNSRVEEDLSLLLSGGWLADDAMVVVERSARGEPFGWPEGLTPERTRRYGETALWYGHADGPGPVPEQDHHEES